MSVLFLHPGFTPRRLPGLVAWYDASDPQMVVPGATFTWKDKSGNGNHATQATAAAQPTTGATKQNGRNVLDFATNDFLSLPSGLFTIPNGPNTIYAVAKRASEDASVDAVYAMGEGNANRHFITFNAAAGSISYRSNNTAANPVTITGNTNTNFQLIVGRRSGTTQAVSVNNSAETTNTSGADEAGIDEASIGVDASGTLFLNGSLIDLAIYNVSHSAEQRTKAWQYYSNKWAL